MNCIRPLPLLYEILYNSANANANPTTRILQDQSFFFFSFFSSVTLRVPPLYLGNREWYHRSAGVKTTGKIPIIALLRGSHGLSARRAWRTLSSKPEGPKAGQKGRTLEVGARRAPRLLVFNIPWTKMMFQCFNRSSMLGSWCKV